MHYPRDSTLPAKQQLQRLLGVLCGIGTLVYFIRHGAFPLSLGGVMSIVVTLMFLIASWWRWLGLHPLFGPFVIWLYSAFSLIQSWNKEWQDVAFHGLAFIVLTLLWLAYAISERSGPNPRNTNRVPPALKSIKSGCQQLSGSLR